MAVRKRQMKHVLFTKPDNPMPGDTIEVYYNPQNTILGGRPNVFLRGGFNRWKHPKPFGPIQMIPPESGDHFRVCERGVCICVWLGVYVWVYVSVYECVGGGGHACEWVYECGGECLIVSLLSHIPLQSPSSSSIIIMHHSLHPS